MISPAMLDTPNHREMDRLVAEQVFGAEVSWWSLHSAVSEAALAGTRWRHGLFSRHGFPAEVLVADREGDMPIRLMRLAGEDEWTGIPHYSRDIAPAMQVVRRLTELGCWLQLTVKEQTCTARVVSPKGVLIAAEGAGSGAEPLVMCRAAVLAVQELARGVK